jgi:hypothetical protein
LPSSFFVALSHLAGESPVEIRKHTLNGASHAIAQEDVMKRTVCLNVAAVLLLSALATAQSADAQYQEGKILEVQSLPHHAMSGGSSNVSEAPLGAGVDQYNVSIELGDTVYTCRYQAQAGSDPAWLQAKTRKMRVAGNTIFVKRLNAGENQCRIVGKGQQKP